MTQQATPTQPRPVSITVPTEPAGTGPVDQRPRVRRTRGGTSLFAAGEPMVWITGGALLVAVGMILGLLVLVFWSGVSTFWPLPVVKVVTSNGQVWMGEVTRQESYRPSSHQAGPESGLDQQRRLIRTGNYRLTQQHFRWVDDNTIAQEAKPPWAVVIERMEWGRFYGFPQAFVLMEFFKSGGPSRPLDDLKQLARQQVEAFVPKNGGQARVLAQAWVDGQTRQVLLPVEDLGSATQILGVAEVVQGPRQAWALFEQHHGLVRQRWWERRSLEKHDTGAINAKLEAARLGVREAEIQLKKLEQRHGQASDQQRQALQDQLAQAQAHHRETQAWGNNAFDAIRAQINQINQTNARTQLLMQTAGEGDTPPQTVLVPLDQVVRAYPANQLTWSGKAGVYLSRWWEFLADEPREANSEGGVYPAIFGTVVMTLIMCVLVVPFGVMAALYLREYAKAGLIVSAVRIAINNLAGVPSIVFGVFGLGFFCYVWGASIDSLFFEANLPNPTYGKGGLMWASLTLALLTLPVVIVATEEALAAVPNSMRQGSYACGASKWQTIRRIILPRAMPGIMTGMILAMARGAGEVAPLMLVGAVKLAPELPLDRVFPYLHPDRSFMHLGFHIYDVGFQSQNSEAAKPMVFTTTLLLIAIIAVLNLAAIWLRTRLRRRFVTGQF